MTLHQPASSSQLERLHPGSLPRICIALTGSTLEELAQTADQHRNTPVLLEFRLDYLDNPVAATPGFDRLFQAGPGRFSLATCRTVLSGGQWRATPSDELDVLAAAAKSGAGLVDLSLESAEALGSGAVAHLRSLGAAVLVSFHDFHGTGDLRAVLERMRPLAPDLYKIVPTANSLEDSLQMLQFVREASPTGALVALSMGTAGIPTRILGPVAGSTFTFAAASRKEATAPGQFLAPELRDLFHVDTLSQQSLVYGVAGDPITSSLSPLMLNTAFRESAHDAVYLPLLTRDPRELFHAARELPLQGFSVTMPLKQAVIPHLDTVDPLAASIGAVNTVYRDGASLLRGGNTDVAGIVEPLRQRRDLRGARVLVLGAGGAARAAVFGCVHQGAEVYVCNRTEAAAEALARDAGAHALPRAALRSTDFDVLIQSTPAGMRGNATALPLEPEELRAGLVFDLVYNPMETPLLRLARAHGCEVIPGAEMFLHQGARQFEIWTGQPAPVEAMRRVLMAELEQRQAAPPS